MHTVVTVMRDKGRQMNYRSKLALCITVTYIKVNHNADELLYYIFRSLNAAVKLIFLNRTNDYSVTNIW